MKRFIALILALLLLFPFVSCAEKNESSDRDTTLQIIEEPAVYSDELISHLVKTVSGDAQKSELEDFIRSELLPTLAEIPVYESEIIEICDIAQTAIGANTLDPVFVCELYSKGVSILGNERNTALAYELTRLTFEYTKDHEKLNILNNELGRESFCDILSLLMFVGSFGSGIIPANLVGSSYISDADILNILRHEANHYAKLDLSAEKWSAGVKLLDGLLRNINIEKYPVSSAVLNELSDSDFFEKSALALPEFAKLLSAVLDKMTASEVAALRKNEAAPFSLTVKKLALCETEFKAFTSKLELCASVDENAASDLINSLGYAETYAAFLVRLEASDEAGIYDAINAYASSNSAIPPIKGLRKSIIAYIFKISPALAFAIERDLAPTTK